MTSVLAILFGSSWKSSLAGYGLAALAAMATYSQAQPTLGGQILGYAIALFAGILGRVSKDADKSNAAKPEAEAKPVPRAP
jgi:hypothetical protein